jgi:hypothetical protein
VCNDQATARAALFVGDLKLIRPAIALQKSCVRGRPRPPPRADVGPNAALVP